jgi:hypothetical protein
MQTSWRELWLQDAFDWKAFEQMATLLRAELVPSNSVTTIVGGVPPLVPVEPWRPVPEPESHDTLVGGRFDPPLFDLQRYDFLLDDFGTPMPPTISGGVFPPQVVVAQPISYGCWDVFGF